MSGTETAQCERSDRGASQTPGQGHTKVRGNNCAEPRTGADRQQRPLRSRFRRAAERQAFGCAGTNRHDVKECKSPTAKVEPTTLAPSHARASVTESVKR